MNQKRSMESTSNPPSTAPALDASRSFRLGSRHYLARPTGTKRHLPSIEGASLATCLQVPKSRTIDADYLRTWRADTLDNDDVFHPRFLQEVVFGGTDDVHLASDTEAVFQGWETRRVSFVSHLGGASGPCYICNEDIYTVWRIYEDRQLAFVLSTWPSVEDPS